jgi:cytochrome c553
MSLPRKLAWLAVLITAFMAVSIQAATVSPSSLTVLVGQSATVSVGSIRGTLSFSTSNPGVFTATKISSTSTSASIKVTGVGAGTATLSVKDNSGTKSVTVMAKAPMTVSPATVLIAVGGTSTLTISNPWSTNISLSYSSTYIGATRSGNSITVTGKSVATNTPLKISDGKTTITVYVTVTSAASSGLNGRLLASNCFQCHGTNGSGGFDRLIGKSSSELYSELHKFATGAENSDGIMAAHAMGYTDAQLRAIANYLATVQ